MTSSPAENRNLHHQSFYVSSQSEVASCQERASLTVKWNVRLLLQPLPTAALLFSHQPLQPAAVRQLRLHTSAPHDADSVSQSVIYLLAVQQWDSCCIYTHAAAHWSCDNGHCLFTMWAAFRCVCLLVGCFSAPTRHLTSLLLPVAELLFSRHRQEVKSRLAIFSLLLWFLN